MAAGVSGYAYMRLSSNIKSAPLFTGTSGDSGHEKPDAFGRTPINILVIGSDGRGNASDCQIGGDCGPGANADVQMVLHVSADRSNATVMSIPRDIVTDLPACTDTVHHTSMEAHSGMINSTLDYGPGCTVAAVHKLTQIPVDHFVLVDFTGVVQMSDALGGVPVCVSDNVYDPYSHLKLKKGTHVLKGTSALQFVRTRHGFGDGSDLGRTVAQHLFIGSMVRQLKSAGTLADPTALLSLANAATKALTVDNGLKGIPQLVGLADDLNKVPANRITMATMQNVPYPADNNRVVVSPAAKNLFSAIINDRSLTDANGGKSSAAAHATSTATSPASSKPAATLNGTPKRDIALHVKNSSGVGSRATDVSTGLKNAGYNPVTSATSTTVGTELTYTTGHEVEAREGAALLGLPTSMVKPGHGPGITLVVGNDWGSGSTFGGRAAAGGATSTLTPADAQAALRDADAQTADDASKCAQVGTQATVSVDGVGMSPTKAYGRSPDTPDSAP